MQVGRRSLLISGSLLGLCADFAVAIVFAVSYSGGPKLPAGASIASIVLVKRLSRSSKNVGSAVQWPSLSFTAMQWLGK